MFHLYLLALVATFFHFVDISNLIKTGKFNISVVQANENEGGPYQESPN